MMLPHDGDANKLVPSGMCVSLREKLNGETPAIVMRRQTPQYPSVLECCTAAVVPNLC
jgi:hypothetical protein